MVNTDHTYIKLSVFALYVDDQYNNFTHGNEGSGHI